MYITFDSSNTENMTKQIRVTKNKAICKDSCETTVILNGSRYIMESQTFYPVIVITNFNQMLGFESMEAITTKNIKTIAI